MAVRKVYIEKISFNDFVGKDGKKYRSVGIQVDGKWINGYEDKITKTWKQGDTVEVEITAYTKDNGEKKFNFKTLNPLVIKVNELEKKVNELVKLFNIDLPQAKLNPKPMDTPRSSQFGVEPPIYEDDLPF